MDNPRARTYSTQRPRRDHSRSQSRSRSPRRQYHKHSRYEERDRDEDRHGRQHRHHHHHRHHHRRHQQRQPLPHDARPLSHSDYAACAPLFAHYLVTEKQQLYDRRQQWKQFVARWNGGELEEMWYEPEMVLRAMRAQSGSQRVTEKRQQSQQSGKQDQGQSHQSGKQDQGRSQPNLEQDPSSDSGSDRDSDFGPALPPPTNDQQKGSGSTVTMPTATDLAERRALVEEEHLAARSEEREALRQARRADRRLQRERLDELAPRAMAGTRERRLEKKRELAAKLRPAADDDGVGGGDADVPEEEVLGGRNNGADDYKRMLAAMQRRRTEREVRREEDERAKAAERTERMAAYRQKEEATMATLRQLARERFGS